MPFRTGVASTLLATAAILLPASPAAAHVAATASYDLPAQDLETSLRAVARISGHQIIIASAAVEGRAAPALEGQYSVEQAVRALLAGTDIQVQVSADAILVGDSGSVAAANLTASDVDAITVTGSRIKGARLASPEIRIDREEIQRAGFGDLGEALRALPQNFSGGQNPGVGKGARSGANTNDNVTGGSSVNLRGLGPDATLTLLNGHRLSFGGSAQGIDISAIPPEAIERIEILPDGASALYGSDAVAGVVNVLLRRSLNGVSANARVGTATEGGGTSQLYQIVGGHEWQGGNVLLAYSYRENEKIEATQREYSSYLPEPYPLIKGLRVHSIVMSASQKVFGDARFGVDATYADRSLSSRYNTNNILSVARTTDRAFSISPSLLVPIAGNWSLSLSATYARSRNNGESVSFTIEGVEILREDVCYCNSLRTVEGYLEGRLLSLPGGQLRTVIGGGFRRNRYEVRSDTSVSGGTQRDAYAFGELHIPLISGLNATPWAKALTISVAGRYDSYNQSGSVTTPKIGIVYSPSNSIDLKYSWGRSFKAPALASMYMTQYAFLLPLWYFGGDPSDTNASALYLAGGSTALRPERATSSTWTATFHPKSAPGLVADLSYFRVRYSDRVLTPIGFYPDALSQNYANYVTPSPSAAAQQAAIAYAADGLLNYTDGPYDPQAVLYLIDNRNTNVAVQKIEGIDLNLSYRHSLGEKDLITSFNGSWLRSSQKNGDAFPFFGLAGSVWNPPHFRTRASIGLQSPTIEAFTYLNYIGGVEDRRTAQVVAGKAMFTVDLSLAYRATNMGGLNGFRFGLSIENLLNRKPPYLAPAPFSEPYDSTNYSPIGRFVALSISKTF